MDTNNIRYENSNVYVRLRLSRNSPCLPKREGYMEIWIKGTNFRVRDETSRYVYEILGDIAAKRGLGQASRTLEEMMDISFRFSGDWTRGVTEIVGDMATNQGLIQEPGEVPWMIETEAIAPVVEQIFTDGLEEQLETIKTLTRFGRTCTEYHGFVEGEEDGAPYKNEIKRIVSPPFVFLNEVRDTENSDYYFIREFVDFEEGKVTDVNVEQPDTNRNTNPE